MRYTTRIIVPPRIRRSGPPGSPGGAYGPQVLGVRRTLGLGDRLGVATPAHLAVAATHADFAPVLAQQSTGEMTQTGRTPADVLGSAARAVSAARYRQPWGADADRLRTAQEVAVAAEAGFTGFTFDPSELVTAGVREMTAAELQAAVDMLVAQGDLTDHWAEPYLDRTIDLPGNHRLRIGLEPLQRAVVRYLPALVHCARLSSAVTRESQGRPFEIEVALDQVDEVASPLEHLFIGLELEARGVRLTGLALRWTSGRLEPGTGRATWEACEQTLREHAAVAEFCGPYKLCFYDGTEAAELYPVIGRVCGEALHVKTSAGSYFEALRVTAQIDPELFRQIVDKSIDQATQSANGASPLLGAEEIERLRHDLAAERYEHLLDSHPAQRCLDAACGSMLVSGRGSDDRPFKQNLLDLLEQHADLYVEGIGNRCDQLITGLKAG